MRKRVTRLRLLAMAAAAAGAVGFASLSAIAASPETVTLEDGSKTQKGAKPEDGKWMTPDGEPTYRVKPDGTLDWYAYSGFRRYHSECHVCHGPEGEGSTYAPALKDSLKTMSYGDFIGVVASGRVRHLPGGQESVMPALGDNKNVMCYIDDIYVYLKARADGAVGRGRPVGRDDKPTGAIEFDKACFGE
ncbi:MAG: c-type cytochrome, methanol metabolism-related [Hyphomicrobiaceae bacterium]|nr:c-type cytochrome, methanol metabolism-related [Hyphomicrobiaceae bacterium]MCC0008207.1 c-type cytochrome, methanol metabolism-related [Hyphomicrobiaceae bacterium]